MKSNNATQITGNHIALTKRAALRNGRELTTAEASNEAAKILERVAGANEADSYGQDFWTAAKEYFLN